jgi:predicted transcriptional regulator
VPIYHALLHQDGVHLPSGGATPQVGRTAADFMRRDVPFVPPQFSVEQALQWARTCEMPTFLVGTPEKLEGTLTRQTLQASWEAGQRDQAITSLLTTEFAHVHRDHPLDVVLERLARNGGVVPVVSRTDAHRVEGVVTAETLLRPSATKRPA